MSYQIEYNPELRSRYPIVMKKSRFSIPVILVVVLCAVTGWILTKSELLHYLVPGDPEITIEAFSAMVEKIDSGVSVGEGIFSFCEEIISNVQ